MKCVTPVDSVSSSFVSCELRGQLARRDVLWGPWVDAYGLRADSPVRGQHRLRGPASRRRAAAATRPGNGAALLRRDPARRRQLPRLGPRVASALGPRAGAAILRADP